MAKKKSDWLKQFEKEQKEIARKQKVNWQKFRRSVNPGILKKSK